MWAISSAHTLSYCNYNYLELLLLYPERTRLQLPPAGVVDTREMDERNFGRFSTPLVIRYEVKSETLP